MGVQWVQLQPPWRSKFFFRSNLQGKLVSAPPAHEVHPQESIFRLGEEILEVGVVHLVVSERLLKVTTKKGRQLF